MSAHGGALAGVGTACSESGLIMCIYKTRSIKGGLLSSLNELFPVLFQILKSSRKHQPGIPHSMARISVTVEKGKSSSPTWGPVLILVIRQLWKHAIIL